jgi:Uma2 family endonuclease
MIQTITKPVTFDEFIDWYPENSEHRYELHNGAIVEMPLPTGIHSEIAGFITLQLGIELNRLNLTYFIPKECLVKASHDKSGYEPDVSVLNRPALENELRWKKESIITLGKSVCLAIEVVSTNWRDDYGYKLIDYEDLGIPEYWIVDYAALGGRRFIGNPKQPTLSIYQFIDDEYQVSQFQGSDRIQSPFFPELNLTAEKIFQAGAFQTGSSEGSH